MASDITLVGSPSWTTGPSGGMGAVQFDGAGGQVGQAPHGDPIAFGAMSAWTLCYFLRHDSLTDAKYQISKDDGAHGGSDFAVIYGFGTSGNVESYTPTGGIQACYADDTAWHFYVWTYTGGTLSLYVDDVFVTSKSVGLTNNTGDLFIAGENVNNVNCAMTLSEMRTYDVVLSSGDMTTLAGGGEVTTNQIGRWLFDEGSGSTAANSAGAATHNLTGTFNAVVSATSVLKANAHLDATFNAVVSAVSILKANAHLDAAFGATVSAASILSVGESLSAALAVVPGFTANLTGGTPVSSGNKIISPYAVY